MGSIVVEPQLAFGLKNDVSDNVCYLDEQNIIYPAGSSVIIYNVNQRTQRFIHGSEGSQGFSALAVSPNRRYVAIAERGEHAAVTIYDLHSLKKRKYLSDSTSECTEFVSMAFSPDSKYLVTLGGKPDWLMHYWAWEKSQGPMAVTKCSLEPTIPVYRASFNPQDNTHICVTGLNTLKMFRYTEGSFKQLAFQKMEGQNYMSQAWLGDHSVVCGTESGKLFLFVGGELKAEVNISDRVTALAPLSNGFIAGTASGNVILFEATEDTDLYKQSIEFAVPQDNGNQSQAIHHIAPAPTEDSIVVTTKQGQLYTLRLTTSEADILRGDEVAGLQLLFDSFHYGSVTGLDVGIRKPLLATCGLDRSVRVWNYATRRLELVKYFNEEAFSVAMHPSGLFVLVGFADKLRLMNLLLDDIRPIKEFSVRECKECCFSNGGHLFAAAQGNVIQIYSTWSFQNVGSLKGHSGRIRSITWSHDDTLIVSCGMDGAVYEWSVFDKRRVYEHVQKTCSYTSTCIDKETGSIYAVGSDKTLKVIKNSSLELELPTGMSESSEIILTQIVMSSSGTMLITASAVGSIRSYKFPLTSQAEWSSLALHVGAIARLRISPDDLHLFSVGEDGCLVMYKLTDKEGRGTKRHKSPLWATEVLITKSDLEEKNKHMGELKRRVEELQMASEYQLRLKDMNYNEKIKEITDKFIQEKEDLKRQLQQLKAEKEKEESKHGEELTTLHDKHLQSVQDLEHEHNQKLMVEYEKYQGLQRKTQEMQSAYEQQLDEVTVSKERALKDLAEHWENKLNEKTAMLEAAHQASIDLQREHDETARQIELDADREILSIRLSYEKSLKEEHEYGLEVKGENGILVKKFKALERDIEEEKNKRFEMQKEQKKLHAHIKALEREIVSGKKEIEERDETIQDKERRIYDLKKKNQELEKFKFVLDYKIKELKKQIEPKDAEIKGMKTQMTEMDSELEKYDSSTTTLDLQLEKLRTRLKATEKSVKEKELREKFLLNTITRFKSELQAAISLVQKPKDLVKQVREMHRKHCVEEQEQGTPIDEDIQEEHNRQRDFLEKNITALKKKLRMSEEARKSESTKIMSENVTLIKEINDLRKELKMSKSLKKQLEGSLKTTRTLAEMRGQTLPPMEETARISGGLTQTLRESYESEQTDRIIELQKQEIRRLRDTVKDMERVSANRPPSSGRLPPMSNVVK
eukprot:m.8941 g.8941  ORF g.8941 m.8941 type:complete len:1202 (-) comp3312_c0_seq1:127-3732(-)